MTAMTKMTKIMSIFRKIKFLTDFCLVNLKHLLSQFLSHFPYWTPRIFTSFDITSASKKPRHIVVVIHYCVLSRCFWRTLRSNLVIINLPDGTLCSEKNSYELGDMRFCDLKRCHHKIIKTSSPYQKDQMTISWW